MLYKGGELVVKLPPVRILHPSLLEYLSWWKRIHLDLANGDTAFGLLFTFTPCTLPRTVVRNFFPFQPNLDRPRDRGWRP